MSFRFLFWILMLLWLIFGLWNGWGNNVALGGHVLLFILFGLLGWKVFGQPLQPLIIASCALLFTGCESVPKAPPGPPPSKAQIALEREKIVEAREVRKDQWWSFLGMVGRGGLKLGVNLAESWIANRQTGFKK